MKEGHNFTFSRQATK